MGRGGLGFLMGEGEGDIFGAGCGGSETVDLRHSKGVGKGSGVVLTDMLEEGVRGVSIARVAWSLFNQKNKETRIGKKNLDGKLTERKHQWSGGEPSYNKL